MRTSKVNTKTGHDSSHAAAMVRDACLRKCYVRDHIHMDSHPTAIQRRKKMGSEAVKEEARELERQRWSFFLHKIRQGQHWPEAKVDDAPRAMHFTSQSEYDPSPGQVAQSWWQDAEPRISGEALKDFSNCEAGQVRDCQSEVPEEWDKITEYEELQEHDLAGDQLSDDDRETQDSSDTNGSQDESETEDSDSKK